MTTKTTAITLILIFIAFSLLSLSACSSNANSPTATLTKTEMGPTPLPEATRTQPAFTPPTVDPDIPLAASVNGQGLPLADFQAEFAQAQAASGTGLATYSEETVLQNLIDEILLAQGAGEAGFSPDEATLQDHIAQLGLDPQVFDEWLSTQGYTPESFKRSLARSIAAAWMRDQIISQVPSTAEQVHARQILLYNSDQAENIYAQLQTGSDFATLAAQNDPLTLGDLGWFPHGYLTVPELDAAIFALQPGEYTSVIETALGFHIVQVIERDLQHQLSPGALQFMKGQAIQDWLADHRSQSEIKVLLP